MCTNCLKINTMCRKFNKVLIQNKYKFLRNGSDLNTLSLKHMFNRFRSLNTVVVSLEKQ